MITLLNIAEQCYTILGKGSVQELIQAVKNAYATAVKNSWFEGKKEGIDEINGSFVYTYKDIKPVYDTDVDTYYITIPTSYLELPHEIGINQVSFMKGKNVPFVRLAQGALGLFSGLKSFVMGGNQVFFVEGDRMYFPKMKMTEIEVNGETRGLILVLTLALDEVDVDEKLNISPAIQDEIISLVLQKYATKEKGITDTLI